MEILTINSTLLLPFHHFSADLRPIPALLPCIATGKAIRESVRVVKSKVKPRIIMREFTSLFQYLYCLDHVASKNNNFLCFRFTSSHILVWEIIFGVVFKLRLFIQPTCCLHVAVRCIFIDGSALVTMVMSVPLIPILTPATQSCWSKKRCMIHGFDLLIQSPIIWSWSHDLNWQLFSHVSAVGSKRAANLSFFVFLFGSHLLSN